MALNVLYLALGIKALIMSKVTLTPKLLTIYHVRLNSGLRCDSTFSFAIKILIYF